MGARRCLVALLGVLAGLALVACRSPHPVGTQVASSPVVLESGVGVAAEFVPYYVEHGDLIGPPLAEKGEFRGRLVQYFRAGRLEYVPENPPGYEVGLAYLGEEVCGRQPPLHQSDIPSRYDVTSRYFAATGHVVKGEFLSFFLAEGGVDVLGPPISEERRVGAETVQDFLRVQVRRGADGGFYLAPLGELVMAGATPAPGLCPSLPADDPDA